MVPASSIACRWLGYWSWSWTISEGSCVFVEVRESGDGAAEVNVDMDMDGGVAAVVVFDRTSFYKSVSRG